MSKKRKGLLQRILMLMLVVCMVCGNGITALADEAVASTMRLTKTEGTVSVTNKNGRDMGTMADMKLFNGYHLTTAQKSYAWMNLDDHKLVKLDAVSEAEIQKKGKDLEVLLNSGNLLFNVTESLKADETLNVRTSTMVTGIRGTCGWVKVLDASRTQVHILEGQVECYVMDPVSGQYKSVTLRSGETAEFVVYDQTRVGDKCDILINRFSEKDIPGFVAVELMDNSDLRDRITGSMNIDMNWIFGNGPTILDQDQKNVEQKFVPLNEAVKQQDHKVTKDPLFGNDDDDDDNDGGGSGSGTVTPPDNTPPTPDPAVPDGPDVDLYMDTEDTAFLATAENLEKYLALDNIYTVNVFPADDAQKNMFYVDRSMIVEAEKTVKFESGINVTVNEGQTFTINGTVELLGGNLINNGDISNVSTNSLRITGDLQNTASGSIDNTGLIKATLGVINSGYVFNANTIDGNVEAIGGTFENQESGTITGSVKASAGGYVILNKTAPSGGFSVEGGTVELLGVGNTKNLPSMIINGTLIVSEGSTVSEISLSATNTANGTLVVNNGGTVTNVEASGGTIYVEGGNIDTIGSNNPVNASVYMNSGTVGIITYDAGILEQTGGTIEFVDGTESTTLIVSGGNIGSDNNGMPIGINLNGAVYSNGDETVSITGAKGTMMVEGGNVKYAALSKFDENGSEDVLTVIAGDKVEFLQQDSGTLEINGGELGSAELINTKIVMNSGKAGVLEASYYESQDVIVNGGEIEIIQVNWLQTGSTYPNLIIEEAEGSEVSINKAILGDHVGFIMNSGTVHELEASRGEMYGGVITNGLFVSADTADVDSMFAIYGGTIAAGNASAAITVDAVVPDDGFNTSDYGYELGNVVVYGGTIDGQKNSAIEVIRGEVMVDMATGGASGTVIKGSNPGELFVVPVTADRNLRVWFGELDENTSPVLKHYTEESYLFFNQSEDEHILKRMTDGFLDALESIRGEECLVMKKSVTLSRYDYGEIYLSPAFAELSRIPAVLDLNGYELNIEPFLYLGYGDSDDNSAEYGLKICDSKKTGRLTLGGLENSAALTLDGVRYTNNSNNPISNKAILNISDSELNATDSILIRNRNGELCVTGESTLSAEYASNNGNYGEANTIKIDGGKVILGRTENDKVEVICDGGTKSSAVYMAYSVTGNENTPIPVSNPQLIMAYSTVSSIKGVAIYADINSVITMNEGATVESGNDLGTIYLASEIREELSDNVIIQSYLSPKMILNAGTIINDGDGYPVTWNSNIDYLDMEPDFNDWSFLTNNNNIGEDPAFVIKDSAEVIIKMMKKAESVLYECCYRTMEEGDDVIIVMDRHLIPEGYNVVEDSNGGLVLQKVTENQALLSFFNDLKTPTSSESIVTSSNATSSDATASDSNASGTPTPSKSAIPMAVAMLAGLMAIAPKLFEDSEDKKRKER